MIPGIILAGVFIIAAGELLFPNVPTYSLIPSRYKPVRASIKLTDSDYWLAEDELHIMPGVSYLDGILYVPDASGGKVFISNRKRFFNVGTPPETFGKATGKTLELQNNNYVVVAIGTEFYLFDSRFILNQVGNTFPA